jgi:hypothetical protein
LNLQPYGNLKRGAVWKPEKIYFIFDSISGNKKPRASLRIALESVGNVFPKSA